MKITIIGSTSYLNRMEKHKELLEERGHKVKMPAFDFHPEFDELELCQHNFELIEWADVVHCGAKRRGC